jgi:hypothetical protein
VTFLCTELNITASQNDSSKTREEFMIQLTGVDLHWEKGWGGTASITNSISLPAVLQGKRINYQKPSVWFSGQSKIKLNPVAVNTMAMFLC